MDRAQLCGSLIKWMQTFQIHAPHRTPEELSDGVAIAQVLGQVAPDWFNNSWQSKIKTNVESNHRLKASNLRKLLQGILEYRQEILNKQITGFRQPDVTAIAERVDIEELGRLLQLVLACAIDCDRKNEYINVIMGLEESVQQVVMNAITELLEIERSCTGDSHINDNNVGNMSFKVKELSDKLLSAEEAKEHNKQRCHELDIQVSVLQDEKSALVSENERLLERLTNGCDLSDLNTPAGRKHQQLQQKFDLLQEDYFKLEQSRDEQRLKLDELDRNVQDLQQKNCELQKLAAEARTLKDENDVLKNLAENATKYEAMIDTYKKKLEEMSDLKRNLKILEDKNMAYMQRTIELEDEMKKQSSVKSQLEVYKKQVQDLHVKLSEEMKKTDKIEFDNRKIQEKLTALQREKERLTSERDALKESNEQMQLSQLQKDDAGSAHNVSESDILGLVPPEVTERMLRLQHENRRLKDERSGDSASNIEVLKSMLDDSERRSQELQSENRIANHHILDLESQLEELRTNQEQAGNEGPSKTTRQTLDTVMAKMKEMDMDLQKRNLKLERMEADKISDVEKIQHLTELLSKSEEERSSMEVRYQKYLEKAKSVAKTLDMRQPTPSLPQDMATLKAQIDEKDKIIKSMEKEHDKAKSFRESEDKLITSAFYNLGMQMQRKAMEERLQSYSQGQQSFLAHQRKATSRKFSSQSEYVDY